MLTDELRERVLRWIADDPDPATRDELKALLAQPDPAATDLGDRFAGNLQFGTAGLRGILGAGPNRINRAVVARATWGFAQTLVAHAHRAKGHQQADDLPSRPVMVGGDARRMSRELSEDAAAILAGAGLRVVLFRSPVPTPLIGFAVKRLHGVGGVVITASHNPPEYNGYKVYWENAAQIIPPADEEIASAIDRAPPAREVARPELVALIQRGLLTEASPDIERAYLDALKDLFARRPRADRSLRIVYTPMHGTGDALVRRALSEAGFSRVTSVSEQQAPDGAFPTVAFPNPEEPGAMDLAFATARRTGADLVLANDPDADRLAVALPDPSAPGGWLQLSGNQVGVLLGHYLLTGRAPSLGTSSGQTPRPRAVLASIVSSPMLGRIATTLGVHYEETLTGFKWIANRAMELEREGYEFVFGYEEALGYCVGSVVRDKDGISAAVAVAEIAAVLREEGRTLRDELDLIARRWGTSASLQLSVTRKGAAGAAAVARMMDRLRTSTPRHIGGDEVASRADYESLTWTDMRSGATRPLKLPRSNVLTFELTSGARIIARPSGTEPKAKFYFDVREDVRDGESVASADTRARATLRQLSHAFVALVGDSG
jgi:phosphomannomutase